MTDKLLLELLDAANKVVLEVLRYAASQQWGSAEIIANFPSVTHLDAVRKAIKQDIEVDE